MLYNVPKINYSSFNLKRELAISKRTIQRSFQLQNYKLYFIDRIEGNYAVCEDSSNLNMVDIHLRLVPRKAKEGSFIIVLRKKLYLL